MAKRRARLQPKDRDLTMRAILALVDVDSEDDDAYRRAWDRFERVLVRTRCAGCPGAVGRIVTDSGHGNPADAPHSPCQGAGCGRPD